VWRVVYGARLRSVGCRVASLISNGLLLRGFTGSFFRAHVDYGARLRHGSCRVTSLIRNCLNILGFGVEG